MKIRLGPGDVAQLGERRLCKPEVAGSTPVVSIVVVSYGFIVQKILSRFRGNELRANNVL